MERMGLLHSVLGFVFGLLRRLVHDGQSLEVELFGSVLLRFKVFQVWVGWCHIFSGVHFLNNHCLLPRVQSSTYFCDWLRDVSER